MSALKKKASKPSASGTKDAVLQIRLSPAHKAMLAEAAKEKGLSLSSWLLSVGLDAARAAQIARRVTG